jgi:hypothetical protein
MAVVKCGAWQGDSRRCDRLGGLQPPETRFQAQRRISSGIVSVDPQSEAAELDRGCSDTMEWTENEQRKKLYGGVRHELFFCR